MKLFLSLLIFILSLQSWTKADDIKSITIEGISIGDSALDYFSEKEIKQNAHDHYKNKSFIPVQMNGYSFFKTYDAVDFDYKAGDKNYIIHALSGVILYENNIADCYKKMDEVVLELSNAYKNEARWTKKKVQKHSRDKSGKSLVTLVSFWFDSGDRGSVSCYDYSDEIAGQDHLSVAFSTKEHNDFLLNEAYK